jgi:hypothetical protein
MRRPRPHPRLVKFQRSHRVGEIARLGEGRTDGLRRNAVEIALSESTPRATIKNLQVHGGTR